MAQHPDSMYTPLHRCHNREIQSGPHLSNVAISFLTLNEKKRSDINHGYQRGKYTFLFCSFCLIYITGSNLEEPNRVSPRLQSQRNTRGPPVCPWPCCSWSSSSWLRANNPAHLMSIAGKARWSVDLIICSYCVICVVQKRWILSLARPVKEISVTLSPETYLMPIYYIAAL